MPNHDSALYNQLRSGKISPLISAYFLYIAGSFANLVLEIPLVRLFERSICNRHYQASMPEKDVDESLCKVAPVQDELATVVGWQLSFNALAGLLTAVYYGRLAERKGRRHVLFLSTCGMIFMFAWVVAVCETEAKVELAWLSSIFLLVGGGLRVFNAMCFATVSDALGNDERSKYLYLLHAGPHTNRLLAPRIAAGLMSINLLWPFFCSFAILGVCLAFISLLYSDLSTQGRGDSEANYQVVPRDAFDEQEQGLLSSSSTQEPTRAQNVVNEDVQNPDSYRNTMAQSHAWYRSQLSLVKRLFSPPLATFCLTTFLFKRIAFTSENFAFQYTSEKFGWALRDTTWLRLTAGIGAVLTTMVICPLLTVWWKKRLWNSHMLDLLVVRVCLVVLCMSFTAAFLGPTADWFFPAMLGMGLGEGTEPSLQGLVTHISDPADYSQLFGILAMVDNIAELVGGPLSASLMSVGRSEQSASRGLNFLSSAVMFGVLALWALIVGAER